MRDVIRSMADALRASTITYADLDFAKTMPELESDDFCKTRFMHAPLLSKHNF
jgi:hypothetical protein